MIFASDAFAFCVEQCGSKEQEENGFCYRVKGKKRVSIYGFTGETGYDGNGLAVTIPATLGGLPVTKIATNAFNDCDKIKKITISENVTEIGKYAFYDCDLLQCVDIPDSVVKIKRYAFYDCDVLAQVSIGTGVKKVMRDAFCSCPLLSNVYFNGNAPKLSKWVFCRTDDNLNVCLNGCYSECTQDVECPEPLGCNCATFECEEDILVTLSSFEAVWQPSGVVITWVTEAEIDNAYFNLYRAESEEGPYEKINSSPISAKGESPAGASYVYTDTNLQSGMSYWYKLEDVDLSGYAMQHGPCGEVNELQSCSYMP